MSLKHIRENCGLSRKQLAEKSGVNFRSLQDYEQGHKNLCTAGADTLLRLSTVLGCSIEELLWDSSDSEAAVLMPQNDVSVGTILAQRFYCQKYRTFGRWLVGDGKICIYFVYKGIPYRIPFSAIIKEDILPWVKEAAIFQMEAVLDELEFEWRWGN